MNETKELPKSSPLKRGMKIYLVANFRRQEELRDYRLFLQSMGYVITSRWLEESSKQELNEQTMAQYAQRDIEDITRSHCCINFTERHGVYTPGGRHIELGWASALKKRCFLIGRRENIFHYHPQIEWFSTWRKFCEAFWPGDLDIFYTVVKEKYL